MSGLTSDEEMNCIIANGLGGPGVRYAYWWLEHKRYFQPSRELWLEEGGNIRDDDLGYLHGVLQ